MPNGTQQTSKDWVDDLLTAPAAKSAPASGGAAAAAPASSGDWVDDLLKPQQRTAPVDDTPLWQKAANLATPITDFSKEYVLDPIERMSKTTAEGAGHIARSPISLYEGIKHLPDTLRGATPYAPQVGGDPTTPEQFAAKEHPVASGVLQGAGEFAGGMIGDPRAWVLGLGSLGNATIARLVSGGFSLQMIHGAAQNVPEIEKAIREGNTNEASRLLTHASLNLVGGVAAGAHAIAGGKGAPSQEKVEIGNTEAPVQTGPLGPRIEPDSTRPQGEPVTWPATHDPSIVPEKLGAAITWPPQAAPVHPNIPGAQLRDIVNPFIDKPRPSSTEVPEPSPFVNKPDLSRIRRELGPSASTLPSAITDEVRIGDPEATSAVARFQQLPPGLRAIVPERLLGLPERLPQEAEPETEQPRSDLSDVDRSKVQGGQMVDPKSLDIDFNSHPFMIPDDVEKAKERIDSGEVPSALVHTDPATGKSQVVDGHGSIGAALEKNVPIRAIEASNIQGEGEAIGARVASHYAAKDKPEVTAEIGDDPAKPIVGQDAPRLEKIHDALRENRPMASADPGDWVDAALRAASPEARAAAESVEAVHDPRVETNASGDSAASLEAVRRSRSEDSAGIKRFVTDTRTGRERPLTGPDAIDYKVRPWEISFKRDAQGRVEVVDRGEKAVEKPSAAAGKMEQNLEKVAPKDASKDASALSAPKAPILEETPKPSPQEIADIREQTGLPLSDEAAAQRIRERNSDSIITKIARGERLSSNPIDLVGRLWTETIGKRITGGINDLINFSLGKIDLATGLPLKRAFRSPESFLPKEYLKQKTGAEAATEQGARKGLDLGKRLSDDLNQQTQQILMKVVDGSVTPNQLNILRSTPRLQDAIDAAKDARQTLDSLGADSVMQDMLNSPTFFKNYGKYVPRLYRNYEVDYNGLLAKHGETAPNRLDLDRFRRRDDLPAVVRAGMGEITEAAYPVAKGIRDLSRDVAYSKFFEGLTKNKDWVSDVQKPGMIQMPDTFKLGKLSEKWVDRDIARDVNEMLQVRSEAAKLAGSLMGAYKKVRVVWSPASFVWHNLSRTVLNYLDGLPPYRVDIYAKALKDRIGEGPLYKKAMENGVIHQQSLDPEVFTDLIDSWNKSRGTMMSRMMQMGADLMKNVKAGKDYQGDIWNHPYWSAARDVVDTGPTAATGGLSDKVTNTYSALDDWMKMAKFSHNLEKGMSDYDAAVDARKATIDYRNVPKMVDWGRRTITPFITFPSQALPRLAKSAVEAPWRLLVLYELMDQFQKHARQSLGISKEEEDRDRRLSQPHGAEGTGLNESVGGFNRYVLLPARDKSNRLQFLDMNHLLHWTGVGTPPAPGMLPFGSEKLGGPLSLPAEIAEREIYGNPIVSMFGPVAFNKDPYTGRALYGPGEEHEGPMGALAERAYKTWTPGLAPGNAAFGKVRDAIQGKPDYFGRPSDLPTTLGSQLTGLNVRPLDPNAEAGFRDREFKEAMEDIRKGLFRIEADNRLTDDEKQRRMGELTKRQTTLISKYQQLYSGKEIQAQK